MSSVRKSCLAVHYDRPLTNISVGWMQDQMSFVSDQVYPIVPTMHLSDRFYVWGREAFLTRQMKKRAKCTKVARFDNDLTTDTFKIDWQSVGKGICWPDQDNQDPVLNIDRTVTMEVTQQAMMQREWDFWNTQMTTGKWANEHSVVNGWGCNEDAADPACDVQECLEEVAQCSGRIPNTIVMNWRVFNQLRLTPAILSRIVGGSTSDNAAVVTRQALAAILGVERVLVSSAIDLPDGAGDTECGDFILGDNVLVAYVTPNAAVNVATAGYTFAWTAGRNIGANGIGIFRWDNEACRETVIEADLMTEHKQVSPQLGCLLTDVLAPDSPAS